MNNLVYTTLLSTKKRPNSPYVFCHKNGKPYRDVRTSLDKAARETRIEVVEALARRMDTTGREKERAKNRHAEVVELVDTQHSGCCGVIPLGVRLPPSAP